MKNLFISAFLVAVLSNAAALAQKPEPHPFGITATDLAITFTTERAKIQSSPCSCFWLNGGSADGAVTFYRGLSVAANLTAEHASNVTPGLNLGKFSFMIGPRYTFDIFRNKVKKRGTRVFGEWLLGGVHGFDSVFPGPNGSTFSAGAFSTQLGIGSDIAIRRGFGVRLFEVDYVHTTLPNNGSNSQNDLRLAFGLSYRFAAR
jgi:hypothetical protein